MVLTGTLSCLISRTTQQRIVSWIHFSRLTAPLLFRSNIFSSYILKRGDIWVRKLARLNWTCTLICLCRSHFRPVWCKSFGFLGYESFLFLNYTASIFNIVHYHFVSGWMFLAELLVRSLTEIWWVHPGNRHSILLLEKSPRLIFNHYSILVYGDIYGLVYWFLTFKWILNVYWSSSLAVSLWNMYWL